VCEREGGGERERARERRARARARASESKKEGEERITRVWTFFFEEKTCFVWYRCLFFLYT